MMEVTTDEEAQAVLDGMEATQYITIQRADSESISKVPLITLNGELISEGMVVDMINAGVGTEYNSATPYYETDDLLPHELTEEDRKLAAALVAVQLQQQQKHQQIHNQLHQDDTALPDVSQLATLSPVNAYAIQTIADPEPSSIYSAIQSFKRINHHVKQEFINVKSEYDIDVSAESSEEASIPISGPKRSLPHKKRIARKLKQQNKTNLKHDSRKNSKEVAVSNNINENSSQLFKCELCNCEFTAQLKFFEHLKNHYEPVKQESRIGQATNTNITISVSETAQNVENSSIEEFSEPEDLMEGIRGVVEETGARIDDDTETSPLTEVNHSSTLWSIATSITETISHDLNDSSTVNQQDLQNRVDTEVTDNIKKKKINKTRKTQNNEMICPQCDRSFHHKNSLVYHMRSHSGERPHQCEICGKSFFAASALKVHKRLHSGDKPYKCEDCGRHFRQWGDLKYHSMSIHSEQRQFQCEYCGKDFARKYSLIVHRRIHTGEKNYRCEYCNKTFRASSYLQNHRRIHTGEKPHPCTVCGKPFRVRSDMKRHLHTHTKSRSERPINRTGTGKIIINEKDKSAVQSRTLIQDLVQELKLESPNSIVEIVSADDNPESILPHEGGSQNLEYNVTDSTDANSDRDPLEAVDRTSDTLASIGIMATMIPKLPLMRTNMHVV
ncbi:myoneurin isoform X1 [Microplitis demolitor]|uniref:myoneurin isoform X1 n=1 Tax=Microplitis demolitor TaxID=69319 RepID=UPI0004CDA198|nr:myoneurin isoform X1 [Microplitis demolitor]XP_014297285.1 myoneurin isoform X1 [Microplitis demolitor]XP_014297286.1 myoneurin isoform X1 [Microplitis demolitor]XP_053598039.1 myoneurin isoform X1 [Microplitis demolitor]XP_053598040.1 myoneurin isoform X1 [Microplitis demolitor]